jgi:hypothetical protein
VGNGLEEVFWLVWEAFINCKSAMRFALIIDGLRNRKGVESSSKAVSIVTSRLYFC